MRRQRGYTLIEVLATMGLTSALLALLAGWLTATMHNQRLAAEHLRQINSQERLASQFRQDVHAARGVLTIDSQQEPDLRLRLDLGSERDVAYLARAGMCERVESVGAEVVHREQYSVAPKDVLVKVDQAEHRHSVALLIGRSASAGLRIEAALGSDYRFTKEGEYEE
jgi:prepilin-type N-terminal cleavage/methylation domain-containing protein